MTILFKACPRCHGDLLPEVDHDHPGDTGHVCILCGYRQSDRVVEAFEYKPGRKGLR